jgi:hypothetical protein
MQKLRTISDDPTRNPVKRNFVGITTRKWMRFRKRLHAKRCEEACQLDESVCVDCAVEGRNYGPLLVDAHHIKPREARPDLLFDSANIEFVCRSHHGMRTLLEQTASLPGRTVVYGKPGAGKTTHVAEHASTDAWVWDADVVAQQLGYPAYPRTVDQSRELLIRRDAWLIRAQHKHEVWCIVMRPRTAYRIAAKLRAGVIRLSNHIEYTSA